MTTALLYDVVVWSLLVLFCWSLMSLLALLFIHRFIQSLPKGGDE